MEYNITYTLIAEMHEPLGVVLSSSGEYENRRAALSVLYDEINGEEGLELA